MGSEFHEGVEYADMINRRRLIELIRPWRPRFTCPENLNEWYYYPKQRWTPVQQTMSKYPPDFEDYLEDY